MSNIEKIIQSVNDKIDFMMEKSGFLQEYYDKLHIEESALLEKRKQFAEVNSKDAELVKRARYFYQRKNIFIPEGYRTEKGYLVLFIDNNRAKWVFI